MSNEFDLERFKDGEPAYSKTEMYYFVGISHKGINKIAAETSDGTLVPISYDGNCFGMQLTMKPKVKKVDWSKMPVDTRLILPSSSKVYADGEGGYSHYPMWENAPQYDWEDGTTISPDQPWTFWQGGECPIPDGLEFEAKFRNTEYDSQIDVMKSNVDWEHGNDSLDIIAYRLTGKVLEGWEL